MPNIIEFELLDMLDKTKNLKYLRNYVRKICINKDTVNVREYLLKKVNSKTILELISREWERLNAIYDTKILKQLLLDDQELLKECIKINFTKIFKDVPTSIFQRKINDITLIDYLFQNNYISKNNIDIFLPCENIFKYIKKYNKEELLKNINLNELLLKTKNNKLYLDEFIEANIDIEINNITTKLINKILEKKAYYLLIYLNEKQLLKIVNNETILELLLKNGLTPNINKYTEEKSIKLIAKYDKHELLQNTDSNLLMLKNNKYIIEEMLEKQLKINDPNISNPNIVYYIIKHKRTDLYYKFNYSTLLSNLTPNNKYLDVILEHLKIDDSIEMPRIKISNLSHLSFKQYAQIYICYAKHNLEHKLPTSLSTLLIIDKPRKKTFLEYLLEEDEEITKEKFIKNLKEDEVQIILKLHEYKKRYLNIDAILEQLIQHQQNIYKVNNTDSEIEMIINELIEVFSDEYKDEKVLELLKINYTYLCMKDKKYIEEVKRIIELKRNIPHLSISITEEGTFYKQDRISLSKADIYSLNHELGHLFFHFNAKEMVPQELDIILFKLSNDKNFIEKNIKEFANMTEQIIKSVESESEKIYETFLELNDVSTNNIEDIIRYLENSQQRSILYKCIKSHAKSITLEDYKNKDKRIKLEMIKTQILKNEYPGLLIISDIIDAIFLGKFFDNLLKDKEGKNISALSGHGIVYYSENRINAFNEMIANYNAILKIKDSEYYIELLRKVVGDELVDLLETYYNEKILFFENKSYCRR